MANTNFTVNDPLAARLWAKKLAVQAIQQTWFRDFISDDGNNVIYMLDDAEKSAGDAVNVGPRTQRAGAGIQGDGTLEGHEYGDFRAGRVDGQEHLRVGEGLGWERDAGGRAGDAEVRRHAVESGGPGHGSVAPAERRSGSDNFHGQWNVHTKGHGELPRHWYRWRWGRRRCNIKWRWWSR